ncbi:DUF726 domain containing protein [Niveomyces insectorum RCEF 264]|uniref:DUF726 domain containing protein n=1 Tax=Niveomyces insectorum RCEF 264 TaxID=1081102 RepID=A0A167PE88_9HYPO|nr:DUF726 domain containing protein [Niveomyces insectorum RCEF 264]
MANGEKANNDESNDRVPEEDAMDREQPREPTPTQQTKPDGMEKLREASEKNGANGASGPTGPSEDADGRSKQPEPPEPSDAASSDAIPTSEPDDETPAKKLERVLKQRAAEHRRARERARKKKTPQPEPTPGEAQKSPDAAGFGTPAQEFDDFGLPIPRAEIIQYDTAEDEEDKPRSRAWSFRRRSTSRSDAEHSRASSQASSGSRRRWSLRIGVDGGNSNNSNTDSNTVPTAVQPNSDAATAAAAAGRSTDTIEEEPRTPMPPKPRADDEESVASKTSKADSRASVQSKQYTKDFAAVHEANTANQAGAANVLSEFSHQKLATETKGEEERSEDGEWQTMPAFAPYDIYDDDNRLIAREHVESEDEKDGYANLGGAGKGYTRVFVDDDAESATSMDDNTQYLFKAAAGTSIAEDEEEQRDAVSQMQATKDLLTEGQRIAYVGITRLHMYQMVKDLEDLVPLKKGRKELTVAADSTRMWSQKMMIRLYAHMDISLAEQVMIEQLSEHGVQPRDLTPALMANARVKNPMAGGGGSATGSISSPRTPMSPAPMDSPRLVEEDVAEPPPPYEERQGEELPDVRTPSQLPTTAKIDIDLRWTVLCDLFLVLIADSVYDARSRVLLERVGQSLDVPAIDICKFEKKVTEALEMQQNAEKENWDEKEHMESRRKLALKRRYVMMGLATVGGGLVIGLSAGLLAPVIGAGLAAGFTTIGVTGTSGFLAGAGGAAIITSSAAASGGVIGVRAANRRTGAVRTFEYRPLHNNKRVNLIVTVSGWMTGKVDDVRLPYSTVDPVMGDIYSVLWEPEMLTSMGDTINILATEALTQGLQQLLGSTILVSLMAALQLPVVLTKLSYLIDNPWAVSLDRATMAGLILADSLIDRNLGTRPITLVGYSLGSRVIFSCLKELARKGAFGVIQNVFLFGSPIVVKHDEYMRVRAVVAGRFVNGYNRNDWILGYLFRLTNGGIRRIAGLGAVEGIPGLENFDVTEFVVGHMDYRTAMPRLLRECGWLVESDEFTEIEDPDPENHAQRQRELINEIEEARKELEKESKAKKGGAFSFFNRKKKGEKQEWEIYEDLHGNSAGGAGGAGAGAGGPNAKKAGGEGKVEDADGNNHGVLFDVDAIRAELARERNGDDTTVDVPLEQLQVRELESTLPPMKLDLTPTPTPSPGPAICPPPPTTSRQPLRSPRAGLPTNTQRRVTDTAVAYRASQEVYRPASATPREPPVPEYRTSEERTPTVTKTLSLPRVDDAPARPDVVVDHEGVSMTFDYGYDEHSHSHSGNDGRQQQSHSQTSTVQKAASPFAPPPYHATPPTPPPKDSSYMQPAGTSVPAGLAAGTAGVAGAAGATALADPWAEDEEDDEFGKEQEISMTFA